LDLGSQISDLGCWVLDLRCRIKDPISSEI
jgi:hypothetical protein